MTGCVPDCGSGGARPVNENEAVSSVQRIFGGEVVVNKRKCKLCDTELIFINGPNGKTMVFDAKPKTAWYLDEAAGVARSFKAHTPHWATCPHAEQFKKEKKA